MQLDEKRLDPKLYSIFRLDGHSFSKFVKQIQMDLPFDKNFTTAMKSTSIECFSYFKFFIGFVGSDQITYVLRPLTQEQLQKNGTLDFNGRVQKMVSLLAGKMSTTFFIELTKLLGFEKTKNFTPHFDCRVFQVLTFQDVFKNISQRISYTLKNSRMMLAQKYYNQKQLNKIPSKMAVQKLNEEKNINYEQIVEADNRVGNILTWQKQQIQKTVNIKGEEKLITCDRKSVKLTNCGPKELLQLHKNIEF